MRSHWAVVLLGSLALGCSHNKSGEGNEVKMTLDEVPPAVRSTMMQEVGGAKIGTIDKEEKNGKRGRVAWFGFLCLAPVGLLFLSFSSAFLFVYFVVILFHASRKVDPRRALQPCSIRSGRK